MSEAQGAAADAESCSICFEAYTTEGEHTLSCLKCGHVFGRSCIDKWLKSHSQCPLCNQR
jgi:E3 ubiquitin-protein ligase RFWD3